MPIRTKSKHALALQRAQDFAAIGVQPESSTLPNQADVEVDRTGQKNVQRARRVDVFSALRFAMDVGAYDAARRFERDLTVRHGEHDQGSSLIRVDNGRDRGRQDAMIMAGQRVDQVRALVGLRDGWLLMELCRPSPEILIRCADWRAIVSHITGETNTMAIGAAVRSACSNLAMAYAELDRSAV